ncbi:uncharacterized protein JCM10292_002545 [Rhodotorula paludigena]|uniref:uncharacterized protein n=1 Tax=Rhodotorula paludigena TaxID=86838 RepID=UPI0031808F3A
MSGLSSRQARATYHPGGYGVSEGLKRARRPFFTRNLITGSLISAFALSVYLYSIRAVAQDDFSDLDQPLSEEQRRNLTSIEDEQRLKNARTADRLALGPPPAVAAAQGVPAGTVSAAPPAAAPSSVFGRLRSAFGGRGTESTLVWNAPSVDRIGRIGEEVPPQQYARRLV